jgi:hypothetical protein
MTVKTVAMLTAGGLAPCLSSAVGGLIRSPPRSASRRTCSTNTAAADRQQPRQAHQRRRLRQARPREGGPGPAQRRGRATHQGRRRRPAHDRRRRHQHHGRRPRGLPPREQLRADVVGLPKTIDNDVVPIRQSLGAWTAAEQGSIFAQNIIAEHSSNPRMLIVHEVMGRNCGWLTAETARRYHQCLAEQQFVEGIGLNDQAAAGTSTPSSCPRTRTSTSRPRPSASSARHGRQGCVNIFLSEGAGVAASSPRWRPRRSDRPRRLRSREASTRSTQASGSPSSSPSSSAPRRRWCRRAATSPAPPRPTPRTSPSSSAAPTSRSTPRWPVSRASSGRTRTRDRVPPDQGAQEVRHLRRDEASLRAVGPSSSHQ